MLHKAASCLAETPFSSRAKLAACTAFLVEQSFSLICKHSRFEAVTATQWCRARFWCCSSSCMLQGHHMQSMSSYLIVEAQAHACESPQLTLVTMTVGSNYAMLHLCACMWCLKCMCVCSIAYTWQGFKGQLPLLTAVPPGAVRHKGASSPLSWCPHCSMHSTHDLVP